MFQKMRFEMQRVFYGVNWQHIRTSISHFFVSVQLLIVMCIFMPFTRSLYTAFQRSGVLQAVEWLGTRRLVTDDEKTNLFAGAFVSFLFINAAVILWLSLTIYGTWFFFFSLQMLCFMLLLFNLSFMRKWLGSEDNIRPDMQCTCNSNTMWRPIAYYARVILFMLTEELKKLLIGIFWFVLLSLIYVIPIYFKG